MKNPSHSERKPCRLAFPEEIFGTEEVPEYIPSDSSAEEEDATSEQKTNHQLRRRIRHLEHDLRDITARCSAERERRMSLEALVGGKIFILI
jgi:transcription elongation GreA/GreB family factor